MKLNINTAELPSIPPSAIKKRQRRSLLRVFWTKIWWSWRKEPQPAPAHEPLISPERLEALKKMSPRAIAEEKAKERERKEQERRKTEEMSQELLKFAVLAHEARQRLSKYEPVEMIEDTWVR